MEDSSITQVTTVSAVDIPPINSIPCDHLLGDSAITYFEKNYLRITYYNNGEQNMFFWIIK